jgi:hypothetical protein
LPWFAVQFLPHVSLIHSLHVHDTLWEDDAEARSGLLELATKLGLSNKSTLWQCSKLEQGHPHLQGGVAPSNASGRTAEAQ